MSRKDVDVKEKKTEASLASATKEVEANFKYFQSRLPELMKNPRGQFALLHKRQIIEFFESEEDAVKTGKKDYGKGRFSAQQVSDICVDLGIQSNFI